MHTVDDTRDAGRAGEVRVQAARSVVFAMAILLAGQVVAELGHESLGVSDSWELAVEPVLLMLLATVPLYLTVVRSLRQAMIRQLKAQADMERSRRFLHTVIEAAPQPHRVVDLNYTVVLANQAACDTWNRGQNIVGRKCHVLCRQYDVPCHVKGHECPLQEVLRTRRRTIAMCCTPDAAGRKRHMEVTAAPIFDDQGNIVQVIESFRDVTAWLEAEEVAQAENAKLSAMISGMEEGVVFANADNVVVEANTHLCRFVGRSREELTAATREWNAGAARFGSVTGYDGERLSAPLPPWSAA